MVITIYKNGYNNWTRSHRSDTFNYNNEGKVKQLKLSLSRLSSKTLDLNDAE